MFLPIIAMFIRELTLDKSLIESIKSVVIKDEINPWILLTKRSITVFKKLFRIEELY